MSVNSIDSTSVCDRHPGTPIMTTCTRCGKNICRECVGEFGYFCGRSCQDASKADVSEADVAQRQREEQELADVSRKTMLGIKLGAALFVLMIAWWIYGAFIVPPGKAAWTWSPSGVEDVHPHIISLDGEYVNVLVGDEIFRIKAGNGKCVGSVKLPQTVPPPFFQVETTPRFLRLATATEAFDVDFHKNMVWKTTFPETASAVVFSDDHESLFLLHPPLYDYQNREVSVPSMISRHRFKDNSSQWKAPAEEGDYQATRMIAADGKVVILGQTGNMLDDEIACRLSVLNGETGKREWRLSFDQGPVWGPEVEAGMVFFHAGDHFVALSLEGEQKWSISIPLRGLASYVIKDGYIFLQTDSGEECRDLLTGEKKWRCDTVWDGGFVVKKGNKWVTSGYAKNDRCGTAFAGGEDAMNEILKDVSGGIGGVMENMIRHPVLISIDAKSGKIVWQRSSAFGQLLGDDSKLVEISGGGFGLLNRGDDVKTVIRQLSYKNGEFMYNRSLKYSVAGFGVVDNRLVGVAQGMPETQSAVLVGLRLK